MYTAHRLRNLLKDKINLEFLQVNKDMLHYIEVNKESPDNVDSYNDIFIEINDNIGFNIIHQSYFIDNISYDPRDYPITLKVVVTNMYCISFDYLVSYLNKSILN